MWLYTILYHLYATEFSLAESHVLRKYISPGPWCEFGNETPRPSITFRFLMDKAVCNLTIEEGLLKDEDVQQIPIILFSANFHHELIGKASEQRLKDLHQTIGDWASDVNLYEYLVNDVFLAEETRNGNIRY